MAATIFAVDTIREYEAGRIQHASILAGYAERYLGVAIGSDSSCFLTKTIKTDRARKGGFEKAAKNIPIKTRCLEHYKANILEYSGMDDASEKLEKEFPMGFKAIRGWLTDFHKENPSIKKPHVDNKQSLSIYLLAEGIHALCLLC